MADNRRSGYLGGDLACRSSERQKRPLRFFINSRSLSPRSIVDLIVASLIMLLSFRFEVWMLRVHRWTPYNAFTIFSRGTRVSGLAATHARIRQTSLNYAAKMLYNIYHSMQTTRLPSKTDEIYFKCMVPLGRNTAARKIIALKTAPSREKYRVEKFSKKDASLLLAFYSKLIHRLRILPSPILVVSTNGRPPTQSANCVIIFPPVGEKVEKDVRTPRRRD